SRLRRTTGGWRGRQGHRRDGSLVRPCRRRRLLPVSHDPGGWHGLAARVMRARKHQANQNKMTREQLKEAIDNGTLYVADKMANSAYVYFEPTGKEHEHEHAVHYVKTDGVWTWENGIY